MPGPILAAARKGEFTPLRHLEPSTDRALEAICSKAMAEAPEDRYATPRALADDVERWMADEPVTAYRDLWSTRARRWLGRHRTAATAAGLLALIAVIGITSLSLISAARDREALKAKEADGYRREALQNEAESYMNYAIHVSDRYSIRWKSLGPDVQSELIRGLLAALERREQNPEAVTRAARAFLESMDVAEKEAVRIRAAGRADRRGEAPSRNRRLRETLARIPHEADLSRPARPVLSPARHHPVGPGDEPCGVRGHALGAGGHQCRAAVDARRHAGIVRQGHRDPPSRWRRCPQGLVSRVVGACGRPHAARAIHRFAARLRSGPPLRRGR